MKPDFGKKTMDIGTSVFNFVRTLMVAGTGGAEINECLLAVERIKRNDDESWIQEWEGIAERMNRSAEQAMRSGQTVTARQAYLRASNYYRAAMFSVPHEFIEDGARQYQLNVPHADELFERGQNRLLLIVLRKIEPNAGIDKNLEHEGYSRR
jgi:hypothetical protein